MNGIISKIEGARVAWIGTRQNKAGDVFHKCQIVTEDRQTGFVTVQECGGKADVIKGLKRGDVINGEVSVRAGKDVLYLDLIAFDVVNAKAGLKAVNV